MPANKKLVDKDGEECVCDIIAYFYSDYDLRYHEIPLSFGDLSEYNAVNDLEDWHEAFDHIEKNYTVVDRK